MRRRISVLFVLAIITIPPCFAQKRTESIGLGVFQGFIYKHTFKMGHLAKTYPTGFEVFWVENTAGNKYWQYKYNYPDVGISIGYYNYHNSVIGETISVLSYMDFYINKTRNRHNFKLRIGGGLGFNTNPFDLESNNKNNVLGSTVTMSMQFRATYEYVTNSNWKFGIAPNLTHFSNGAVRLPNLGINVPSLFVTVSKQFGSSPEYLIPEVDEPLDKKIKINLAISAGVSENNGSNGPFPFINLHAYADKRLAFKSAVNAGIDVFMNQALKEQIMGDQRFAGTSTPDFKQLGLAFGHELFVSRVSLLTQIGVYVYKPYDRVEPIYQRIGVKIYTNARKIFGSVNLKTHYATAELVELQLGARL